MMAKTKHLNQSPRQPGNETVNEQERLVGVKVFFRFRGIISYSFIQAVHVQSFYFNRLNRKYDANTSPHCSSTVDLYRVDQEVRLVESMRIGCDIAVA